MVIEFSLTRGINFARTNIMNTLRNFSTPLILLFWLLIEANSSNRQSSSLQLEPPILYNVKNVQTNKLPTCSISSPEIFLYNIAEPSLSLLYHRCKAMFGILMDEIESSYADADLTEDIKNQTREQWNFLSKTVASSFDSAVDRLETEWEYLILVNDAHPLPWETPFKLPIIYETVSRIEYGYLMIEAVVKAGIKEIAGTLQHQLVDAIKKLEDEVGKKADKNDEVTELKLLKRMKKGLSKIKSSFATKLLQKVVDKALEDHSKSSNKIFRQDTFISESLNQMAIVIHAFREKGLLYKNFWSQMSTIYEMEFKVSSKTEINNEVERFLLDLMKDQDKFITLIVQIIARENK